MFAYEFVRHALLAILLITPLFGLLGTMIVNNNRHCHRRDSWHE